VIRAVIVSACICLVALPAEAETDVGPSPWESDRLRIEQTEVRAPVTEATSEDEPRELKYECDQGPGARAAGLSCGTSSFPGTWSPLPAEGDSTPADIERAIREVPMPPLRLHVQPDGRTLVNVDTIFYTEPTTMRRTVALLGHSVRLECTPVRYAWVHGDGTTASTGKPGRPYPAKDVTHRYQRPGSDLRARVDTTYSVRYSVDGGRWTDLAELLTAPGPSTTIDVDEAVPVLTH
jgi:hypothetical protein